MSSPFTTKLFAPSGSPDGVIVASRDDWPGRAIVFPRELVGEVKGRKEYSEPGVYVLVSARQMYIGEGDPVGYRIDSHVNKKDFWRRGVFFTAEGQRLNKAHIQHLESRLVSIAKQTGNTELVNGNSPQKPALCEEDFAFCENFLFHILQTLPLLGFHQFKADMGLDDAEETEEENNDESDQDVNDSAIGKRAALYATLPQGEVFVLDSLGVKARLEITEFGVMVKKDSQVNVNANPNFDLKSPNYAAQRRQLISSGVIQELDGQLVFTRDQFFSSGAAAASVVRGTSSTAYLWKSPNGGNLGRYVHVAKNQL
jgi:hypothetical protein